MDFMLVHSVATLYTKNFDIFEFPARTKNKKLVLILVNDIANYSKKGRQ